jgi:hypothetical protein
LADGNVRGSAGPFGPVPRSMGRGSYAGRHAVLASCCTLSSYTPEARRQVSRAHENYARSRRREIQRRRTRLVLGLLLPTLVSHAHGGGASRDLISYSAVIRGEETFRTQTRRVNILVAVFEAVLAVARQEAPDIVDLNSHFDHPLAIVYRRVSPLCTVQTRLLSNIA